MTTKFDCYSEEEWGRIHGYGRHGEAIQRYVWEGSRFASPPTRAEALTGRLWVCRRRGADLDPSSDLLATMERTAGMYVLRWMGEPGPIYPIADADAPYADVLKKALAVTLLSSGRQHA